MSRSHASCEWTAISFPRVSGDEPDLLNLEIELRKFSPRERG